MDVKQMMDNIESFRQEELKNGQGLDYESDNIEEPAPSKVDVYQTFSDAIYDESKKSRPHGSSVRVKSITESVINGGGGYEGVARAHRKAERDCDLLKRDGEKTRAELVRHQYMMERLLPAIEVVVNSTSPDEVLNCKEALDAFDEFAPVPGNGKGFTASYIKQAYGDVLGQNTSGSDPTVTDAVRRIQGLIEEDSIRAAYGLAKKIKRQIDNGEHIAGDEDYELIGRVASFA